MRSLLVIICLCIFALQSCDQALGVAISNKSATTANIRIIYPPCKYHGQACLNDSVKQPYLRPSSIQVTSNDSINRTYTFTLPPGDTAFVGVGGMVKDNYPFFGQVAVINNKDTVHLDRKFLQLHWRFLYYLYQYDIKNQPL